MTTKATFQKELDDLTKTPRGPVWEQKFQEIGMRLYAAYLKDQFTLQEIETMIQRAKAKRSKNQ